MRAGSSFPVTGGSYDTTYGGNADVAVAKFDLPPQPWKVLGGGLQGALDTPNLAGAGKKLEDAERLEALEGRLRRAVSKERE
jgi:hypothetical protein